MGTLFFTIPVILILILLIAYWVKDFISMTKAAISNMFNIIIILIVAVLLIMMGQGNVLPIDLFFGEYHKILVNGILVLLFILFLALVLSLYPTYLEKILFSKEGDKTIWRMSLRGIITYVESGKIPPYHNKYWHENIKPQVIKDALKENKVEVMSKPKKNESEVPKEGEHKNKELTEEEHKIKELTEDEQKNELESSEKLKKVAKHFRVLSGLFLFIVWSWAIVYIYSQNWAFALTEEDQWFGEYVPKIIYYLNFIFSVVIVGFYFFLNRRKKENDDAWRQDELKNEWYFPLGYETEADVRPEGKANAYLKKFSIGSIVIFSIYYVFAVCCHWCLVSVLLYILLIYMLSGVYLIIRVFRRQLYVQWLSEDSHYLSALRYFGLTLGVFMVIVNIFVEFAVYINSLAILLAGVIIIYTAIILPFKYRLYLKNKAEESKSEGVWKKMDRWLGFIMAFGLTYLVIAVYWGNNLHQIPAENEVIYGDCGGRKFDPAQLQDHKATYLSNSPDSTRCPIYYTAYGGGLKANAWNLRVLNLLDDCKLSNDIVSMSGVSGGSMGIANYALLQENGRVDDRFVQEISDFNILSIEMSWLFGWDLIRELVPSCLNREYEFDRARRSMKYYSGYINDVRGTKIQYYKSPLDNVYQDIMQNSSGCYFPNIIFNSTSTVNRYGVASVYRKIGLFPGAINLLNGEKDSKKQISFLDAASTSNRFPLISPAAHVDGKGVFVDGGYFENSALLSTLSFMKDMGPLKSGHSIIVQVTNSKDNYIEQILNKNIVDSSFTDLIIDENTPTEINSIIKGAINLERHPKLQREMLRVYGQGKIHFKQVGMPYYITMDDIENFFGGSLTGRDSFSVENAIEVSNKKIIDALLASENRGQPDSYLFSRWGIVEPPTSRVMSRPAVLYMNAIIEHHIDFQTSTFKDYISNCDPSESLKQSNN